MGFLLILKSLRRQWVEVLARGSNKEDADAGVPPEPVNQRNQNIGNYRHLQQPHLGRTDHPNRTNNFPEK